MTPLPVSPVLFVPWPALLCTHTFSGTLSYLRVFACTPNTCVHTLHPWLVSDLRSSHGSDSVWENKKQRSMVFTYWCYSGRETQGLASDAPSSLFLSSLCPHPWGQLSLLKPPSQTVRGRVEKGQRPGLSPSPPPSKLLLSGKRFMPSLWAPAPLWLALPGEADGGRLDFPFKSILPITPPFPQSEHQAVWVPESRERASSCRYYLVPSPGGGGGGFPSPYRMGSFLSPHWSSLAAGSFPA